MNKIPKDKLFVQIPFEDLIDKLWLISLFRVNPEIYIKPNLIDSYKEAELDKIRTVFAKCKASKTIHAPIYDPYKYGFDIFKDAYLKTAKVCKLLDIAVIVMHVEYERKKSPSLEEWLKNVLGIWKWIADKAEEDGTTVLLENHNESSPEPVIRILNDVGSDNLKACLDIGHFNAFAKRGVIACLNDYPSTLIKEIHLSDNLGNEDAHMALGKGNIDFLRFFEAVERRGIYPAYAIEAKDVWGVLAGMRHLRKIGKL